MAAQPFEEEGFIDALVRVDGEVDVRLGRWRKSEVREYLESILVAIAVAMALRAFVVEAFKIPSGSMIPTLQVGDHIFVNKFAYGPAIPWTDRRAWSSMPPRRGGRDRVRVPGEPRARLHQARDRAPGGQAGSAGRGIPGSTDGLSRTATSASTRTPRSTR